jgi:phage-related minor tail protein
MNKRATKRNSAAKNSILKFLTVSSVSSDSIVKGIIDDIIKTAVKTAPDNFKVQRVITPYF